jgi:hypothetical protein
MPTEPAMTTEPVTPSEPLPSDIARLCDTIEDCYEFTLSYAAKGLATEAGSDLGRQLREKLTSASAAVRGLEGACAAAAREFDRASGKAYDAFSAVLARDAESSIAALELVLAQPVISSQLIDNLNASIHLRALLTDLFLITEILSLRQMQTKAAAAE